jgi:hypothetical protein
LRQRCREAMTREAATVTKNREPMTVPTEPRPTLPAATHRFAGKQSRRAGTGAGAVAPHGIATVVPVTLVVPVALGGAVRERSRSTRRRPRTPKHETNLRATRRKVAIATRNEPTLNPFTCSKALRQHRLRHAQEIAGASTGGRAKSVPNRGSRWGGPNPTGGSGWRSPNPTGGSGWRSPNPTGGSGWRSPNPTEGRAGVDRTQPGGCAGVDRTQPGVSSLVPRPHAVTGAGFVRRLEELVNQVE